MSNFVKVKVANQNYEYVNLSFVYAIMEEGKRCKLVMAGRDEALVLNESIDDFLARIRPDGLPRV